MEELIILKDKVVIMKNDKQWNIYKGWINEYK